MSKPKPTLHIMDEAIISFLPAQPGQPKGTDVCMRVETQDKRYDIRIPLTIRDLDGMINDLNEVKIWLQNLAAGQTTLPLPVKPPSYLQ